MSIQRRLAVSITLVLIFSLGVGFGLTYQHVLSKVRTEMQAALNVAVDGALNGLDDKDEAADPERRLRRVVAEFDGDRHVKAVLTAPNGARIAQSRLLKPDEDAPRWFFDMVSSPAMTRELALPSRYQAIGSLTLLADAHNEVAEAWSDFRLTLTIMAVFFAMVLLLAFGTIRAALTPIRDVTAALQRIGTGDLSARLEPHFSRELAPLREGFNGMAARLEEMAATNRALNDQIINLQEEERAELARDLHDDVAPFLFGVGADVAMIRNYLAKGSIDEVGPRAEAIAEAVRHMQRHLKHVLRRLAPGALLDLGLHGAIDNLFGFWTARRPAIAFSVTIEGEPLDPPLDAVAFRVVQESISNAVRHGDPRTVDVTILCDEFAATIVVEDDGHGFPNGMAHFGFGLTGMQDRVKSAGGTMSARNRPGCPGVRVEVTLPLGGKSVGAETAKELSGDKQRGTQSMDVLA